MKFQMKMMIYDDEIKTKLVLSIQSRKEVNVKREDEDPNS